MNFFNIGRSPWMGGYGMSMGGMGGMGRGSFGGMPGFGGGMAGGFMDLLASSMGGGGFFGAHHHHHHGGFGGSGFGGGFGHGFDRGFDHGSAQGFGRGFNQGYGDGYRDATQNAGRSNSGDGYWDSAKGGFVVGKSGKLDVNIQQGESAGNSKIQYQDSLGLWQDVGRSQETGKLQTIDAPVGSTVKFRIQTEDGHTFQAGSTSSDGIDHGRVSRAGNGVDLAFEDQAGGGDLDFNDVKFQVSSRPRYI